MRIVTILVLTLLLAACCPRPAAVPTTEEALQREAEQLVRASLTERILNDTVHHYHEQAVSMLAAQGVPPEEAEAEVSKILHPLAETEHERLVEALAPIYRRYYTPAEIHQLLSFYQTEVARKSMRVSSQIAAESRQYVRLWSENFGETFLERLGAEYGLPE